MTTYINARFLTQSFSGVQRYATEILTALDQLLSNDPSLCRRIGPVIAVRPAGKARERHWQNIETKIATGGNGHLWEQAVLSKVARCGTLVSLGNSGPISHKRQLVALHDANIWAIPGAYSIRYRMLHKSLRPTLARKAARLVTVSEYSAQKLADHLGVAQELFKIIPNGADHILRVMPDTGIAARLGLTAKGYLLSVGNQSANKNIGRLIAAHRLAGGAVPPLLIVGGAASGVAVTAVRNGDRILEVGRVSDQELRFLYEQAAGFVFPSLYEGFGIPPLEAMLLGTPVLAARRAALPEVLQDAPIWFDPLNISEMAATLKQFSMMSSGERTARAAVGLKLVKRFRWKESAQLLAHELVALKGEEEHFARDTRPNDRGLPRKTA